MKLKHSDKFRIYKNSAKSILIAKSGAFAQCYALFRKPSLRFWKEVSLSSGSKWLMTSYV